MLKLKQAINVAKEFLTTENEKLIRVYEHKLYFIFFSTNNKTKTKIWNRHEKIFQINKKTSEITPLEVLDNKDCIETLNYSNLVYVEKGYRIKKIEYYFDATWGYDNVLIKFNGNKFLNIVGEGAEDGFNISSYSYKTNYKIRNSDLIKFTINSLNKICYSPWLFKIAPNTSVIEKRDENVEQSLKVYYEDGSFSTEDDRLNVASWEIDQTLKFLIPDKMHSFYATEHDYDEEDYDEHDYDEEDIVDPYAEYKVYSEKDEADTKNVYSTRND